MTNLNINKIISKNKWIIGATNLDEDIHFSSFYLRASVSSNTENLYPGYSAIVSFYENFNEVYYLLKNECVENSKYLIKKCCNDAGWMDTVIRKIEDLIAELQINFIEIIKNVDIRRLNNIELLDYYHIHNEIHSKLYLYARIPEALDRGVYYFTNHLKSILKKHGIKNINEVFYTLTYPEEKSVLLDSVIEFNGLVSSIKKDEKVSQLLEKSPLKARLYLSEKIKNDILSYINKWGYLDYHGYSTRNIPTISDILNKIAYSFNENNANYKIDNYKMLERKEQIIKRHKIGDTYVRLFNVYPILGIIKLKRRLAQLKNFYFLDKIIEEFSTRLHTSEWLIRNMLPEEINEAILSSSIQDYIFDRLNGCIYINIYGSEKVISHSENNDIIKNIENNKFKNSTDKNILKGVIASDGFIKGNCIVINRYDKKYDFVDRNTIIASFSTDPDMLHIIKNSGAVITEQGGVTSHAALICRELGIPAIIGVENLLNVVSTGDTLEVDANNGLIKIVQKATQTINEQIILMKSTDNSNLIGNKAQNLIKLENWGYKVPAFILLNYNKLKELIIHNKKTETNEFLTTIKKYFESDITFVVRSSSINEDNAQSSNAGLFCSFLNVCFEDLTSTFKSFIYKNEEKTEYPYKGCIILQEMLFPEYSGICISCDSRIDGKDNMYLDIVEGSCEKLTNGLITPFSLIIDRENGDIICQNQDNANNDSLKSLNINDLTSCFMQLEKKFLCPIDIEWSIQNGILYILQVRPIVFKLNSQVYR